MKTRLSVLCGVLCSNGKLGLFTLFATVSASASPVLVQTIEVKRDTGQTSATASFSQPPALGNVIVVTLIGPLDQRTPTILLDANGNQLATSLADVESAELMVRTRIYLLPVDNDATRTLTVSNAAGGYISFVASEFAQIPLPIRIEGQSAQLGETGSRAPSSGPVQTSAGSLLYGFFLYRGIGATAGPLLNVISELDGDFYGWSISSSADPVVWTPTIDSVWLVQLLSISTEPAATDGGLQSDAGFQSDAGSSNDAGSALDAGIDFDTGGPSADAGSGESVTAPENSTDAKSKTPSAAYQVGFSCSSTQGATALAGLLLAGWRRRRNERHGKK